MKIAKSILGTLFIGMVLLFCICFAFYEVEAKTLQEEVVDEILVCIDKSNILQPLVSDLLVQIPESEPEAPRGLDVTKPLYLVYKNSWCIDVPVELQWAIRTMCDTYGFMEKYVYGMIIVESAFQPNPSDQYIGLCAISKWCITDGCKVERFTADYKNRDLRDPYINLLTLAELWCFARQHYGLDLMTKDGMMKVCYWHNTGKDPRYYTGGWYTDLVCKYAEQLVPLQ